MSVNTIVWEQRQAGSATNGGGFDALVTSPGTDYSKQDTRQYSLTVTSSGAGSNVLLTAAASSDMNGNVGYLTGGTNSTTGWFLITSVSVGVSLTVVSVNAIGNATGAGGAMSGATFNIGGAVARLDTLLGTTQVTQPGNVIYALKGTNTSTTTNTIGADGSNASGGMIYVIGYSTTRTLFHDELEADMPLFTSATTGISIFTLNAATSIYFANIRVTQTFGTPASRGNGWVGLTAASAGCVWVNCVADGCLNGWHVGSGSTTVLNYSTFIGCLAKNCINNGWQNTGSPPVNSYHHCIAQSNLVNGFSFSTTTTTQPSSLIGCIAEGNTNHGVAFVGTTSGNFGYVLEGCVLANNGGSGISIQATTGVYRGVIKNCIFSNNTTGDVNCATASLNEWWLRINNWFYTVGTRYSNIGSGVNDVSLSGDPFTNSAGHDFSLNNTAGAGALVRAAGYPQYVGPYGGATRNYFSGGAAQLNAAGVGPVIGSNVLKGSVS